MRGRICQWAGDVRTPDRQECHLFRDHSARGTGETLAGEANNRRKRPPQKVTDLLDLVVISGKSLFSISRVRTTDRSSVSMSMRRKAGKLESREVS